ncbi:MAG: class I SAM-dependent methyltransferase, partial [Actinomycetota bacterium]
MDLPYDREQTARAYDEFGQQEWDRHERAPFHRVAFHLHLHYLAEFVHSGDRVLEVGAASGRFTVELARLGARVVVTDISPG